MLRMTMSSSFSKTICILIALMGNIQNVFSQNTVLIDTTKEKTIANQKFNYKPLLVPSALIGYGIVGLGNNKIKQLNIDIRDKILENGGQTTKVDNYLQYIPALSVYALNNLGIKGKNNLKERTVILGTSMLMVFGSVSILKKMTKVERPDGSNTQSFPSRHTALAFAGAEFLYQEYKEQSVWYGVSGYVVASATGVLRMYNNKHWFTDVVAGAGFGILSTKAAYWLAPTINKHLLKNKSNKTGVLFTPYYNGKTTGAVVVFGF